MPSTICIVKKCTRRLENSCLKGADLSIKHGSTTLADISTNVEVIDVLKTAKIGGYCL